MCLTILWNWRLKGEAYATLNLINFLFPFFTFTFNIQSSILKLIALSYLSIHNPANIYFLIRRGLLQVLKMFYNIFEMASTRRNQTIDSVLVTWLFLTFFTISIKTLLCIAAETSEKFEKIFEKLFLNKALIGDFTRTINGIIILSYCDLWNITSSEIFSFHVQNVVSYIIMRFIRSFIF